MHQMVDGVSGNHNRISETHKYSMLLYADEANMTISIRKLHISQLVFRPQSQFKKFATFLNFFMYYNF
jgi:hypothetical protein